MKQRILWLDVAKCFGIFAIYWGHYEIGLGSTFVYTYSVPFFFFMSGCSEYLSKEMSIGSSIRKVFRDLLIPWLFFCLMSVVVSVLDTDCELYTLWPSVWKILQGTPRNSFDGFGLWFLTCLAVTKILFAFIKRIRSSWVVFLVCAVIHCICVFFVDIERPVIPFNADLALYYLLYFGIGYVMFPWIDRVLRADTGAVKLLRGMSFCVCAGFCAYLYFGKNIMLLLPLKGWGIGHVLEIITALLAIWFQLVLSQMFHDVKIFQLIGRNTLYLCGSEYPVRVLFLALLGVLGLQFHVYTSLMSLLISLFTMWLAVNCLIPMEKRILKEVNSTVDFLCTLLREKTHI